MTKVHQKRLSAPKSWTIKRKKEKFIIRGKPGQHSFKTAIPLNLVLKNLMKCVKTTKEVKYVLNNKEIFINNKIRRDSKFFVGFMDTIAIPLTEEYYRMLIDKKGKFFLLDIKENESKIKLCKIKNKKMSKNNLVQLNFQNGENMLVNKKDYKVGETIVIDTATNKIKDSLRFEKGSLVYITGGKKIGEVGKIEEIKGNQIIVKVKNKKSIKTSKDYAFVVGKDKPIVNITKN